MRQPPGRTPPPPPSTLAPPARRRTPGSASSSGAAAPPRAAPRRPSVVAPSPRPVPRPRPRPNHARRRRIALALVLTVLILGGYGVYVGYDKLIADDAPAAETGTGYVASVQSAIGHGQWSIAMGLGFHNLADSYVLRDAFNG